MNSLLVENCMSAKDALVQILLILIPILVLSLINVFGERGTT
jgi:hypothetical protein